MKKISLSLIIAILLNFILICAAFGIEHYLETGEEVNATAKRSIVCHDYTHYEATIAGKPSFIKYETREVEYDFGSTPCWVIIRYTITALQNSVAGVYDFSVEYRIYSNTFQQFRTLEFKIGIDQFPPEKAENPNPSHLAAEQSINAVISWSDGGGSTSYDVYFGTDSSPDSGEFIGNQTTTSYDPGILDYGTTYYWRIDAKNDVGTTTGDVWRFTTEELELPDISISPQNFLKYDVVKSFDAPGPSAEDLAFDGQYLWCADSLRENIYKLDTSGDIEASVDSPSTDPRGLAFDGTYLWTADGVSDKIYKLLTNGNVLNSFDSPGNAPKGLAFDGNYLWHADSLDDKIYKLDISGNVINSFGSPGYLATGLAFDGKYVWHADTHTDRIYKLNTSGAVIESFESPSLSPTGLALDGRYLWHADSYKDKIYQLEMPFVGAIIQQIFTVSNDGNADLAMDPIAVTGDNASEFEILNDSCSNQSISPQGSCTFDLVFAPKTAGEKSAQLELASNDPDTPKLTVSLNVSVGKLYPRTNYAISGIPLLLLDD